MSTAVVLGVRIMKGLSKNNFCLSSSHSAPDCCRQTADQISYISTCVQCFCYRNCIFSNNRL